MRAILHGTWVPSSDGVEQGTFFIWAERLGQEVKAPSQRARVLRHPYAATTLEVADLLAEYVSEVDWRTKPRLTRVVFLPSDERMPVGAGWAYREAAEEAQEETSFLLRPWRVEGLGLPLDETALELLITLPAANHRLIASHRLGPDLRYWGIVAKFGLELLARQRFVPGVQSSNGDLYAVWLPVLDAPEDHERFETLLQAMPPACRAVVREKGDVSLADLPIARRILQSFLEGLIDRAVRLWMPEALEVPLSKRVFASRENDGAIAHAWWAALRTPNGQTKLPLLREHAGQRFYQAWKNWTYRAQPKVESSFRICFRLEPPDAEGTGDGPPSSQWTLRYFLQANDDPSLLVPAHEVWRERGEVLSYLNRRFDNPQEKLLEGLGIAAGICPAIRRSLHTDRPAFTTLDDQEAFTFLRETAHLLEEAGFGVLVPPWWSRSEARLRLRARLSANPEGEGTGLLTMDSLVQYDWELALGDDVISREEFERLAALKTSLVQVRGKWVLLQPDQIEAAIAFWEKHRAREGLRLGEALSLALGAESELDGMAVGEVVLDDQLATLVNSLTQHDQLTLQPTPPGFVGTLRPYQVFGFSWLSFLRRWGFGACLADDMGLGKTIQTIALILHERHRNPNLGPSLIICPTSLVGNWQRELERFAPSLRVMIHHGAGRAEGDEFVSQSKAHDVVISTYGLVRRDIKDLRKVHWANIILDEAQNIKNPLTKQARAVRLLKGDFRVALTGTPVENRLSELWSIMSFLNPGYLGSQAAFRKTFALPIERYQDREAFDQLRKLVRPFILRRLKTDPRVVQDLPEKFEQKVYCNLTREQATLYEATVQDAMRRLREKQSTEPDITRRGLVLAMLTRLKQICNHPALFMGDGSPTANRSGKLNRLCEMLEEILELNERVLIFTQYAQMGALLQRHLEETFGQPVLFMHGGTPPKQRERMLQGFQEDPNAPLIFVLSLKAGGTGLNLMRANHVFHFDRWWNPAVENQATDRAYRLGQMRDVQVRKLICLGTLEERIDALIESKRELAESVVGDEADWLTELSTDELYDLVMLRAEAVEIE